MSIVAFATPPWNLNQLNTQPRIDLPSRPI